MKTILFGLMILALHCSAREARVAAEESRARASDSLLVAGPEVSSKKSVVVAVNWNKEVRPVNPMAYGVNCPACFNPAWSGNPVLLKALATVTAGGKPLIRLHGWGMVTQGSAECWLNPDGTWDGEKIRRALTPLVQAGYKLMIDIPSGPGGEKDPVDAAEMAPLAAALVKIVNVDNRFGIKYWEIPNEREHILSAAAMAAMLSGASKAMKQIDPTIFVGGPATEGVNTPYISDILSRSLADIDFVTVHTYGGDGKQSSAASFESASKAVGDVRQLRERLIAIGEGRYLPIFLDEYNIGWDPNPAIYNNEGAVYFSIIQGGIVDAGGDVSAVWDFAPPHDMSIVQRDGRLTESANLFSLMNQFFYGEEVNASSPDPTVVRIYAVKSKTTQSMVLSNLGASPTDVTIEAQGRNRHRVDVYQISSSGYSVKKAERWSDVQTSTLPERSVTVLISR